MPLSNSSHARGEKRRADDTVGSQHSFTSQLSAKRIHAAPKEKDSLPRKTSPKSLAALGSRKNKNEGDSDTGAASERRRALQGSSGLGSFAANSKLWGRTTGVVPSTYWSIRPQFSTGRLNKQTTIPPPSNPSSTSSKSSKSSSISQRSSSPGNASGAWSSKHAPDSSNRTSTETGGGQSYDYSSIKFGVVVDSEESADDGDYHRSRLTQRRINTAVEPIENAPSGTYTHYCPNGHSFIAPDGWWDKARLTSRYVCPLVDCQDVYEDINQLGEHFDVLHSRSTFNDNCDGTLATLTQLDQGEPHFKGYVVSQNPIGKDDSSRARPRSPDRELSRTEKLESEASANKALSAGAPTKRADAKQSKEVAEDVTEILQLALTTSHTWKTLESLIMTLGGREGWLTAYRTSSDFECRALLQLISLPPRNDIDGDWLNGIKKSHQKSFTGLVCILIAIVGVKGPCQACKNRTPEKIRQCAALPRQAKEMSELQQLVGDLCANCYHFPTKNNCGFPSAALVATKQTPVPIPRLGQPTTAPTAHPSEESMRPISVGFVVPQQSLSTTPIPLPTIPSITSAKDRRPGRISATSANGDKDPSSVRTSKASIASEESTTDQIPHFSCANVISKALSLLTEVSRLPSKEQPGIYTKIAEMVEIVRRPPLNLGVDAGQALHTIAEEWETAPGRLTLPIPGTSRESLVAFSTSYLRREVVDVHLATQTSRGQRVLNKHIPALHQIKVERFDARWDCSLTVLEGFVKVKMGQAEAKVGQGGLFIISQDADCFITNVTHRDCPVQIRWVER